ncbi:hypothetical protein A2630_04490 [Candidatus Woesebacteria bacterium RIFCSPHIGHO2_01_FULL_44_10]|uniref:Uncharacterized protein n=1 Tax=Candidatus Woesebacteria bacterium RIFCSPLOWO2_01_FULL_44_14 TaxID=1802525 RepID=A0A1F8C376_9BACT|nr:MAG: hypothetical protein A2630_04490 [Candidatus Woesebacteria bacterium RIFCSPHIGHO2_01_FULL_44_10]OGM56038.1 MAG: hypothetical protein A3F62_03915 [Candidatus Woesebacteria bacterium RIFCSPHIGHO2_12_FULL_44_11]OGM70761.1 MAG: hypothetical protein A2975_02625 [Candidatus Woesebacteria bacterium RIFCSPLOWO2_01_FULL_44_14]
MIKAILRVVYVIFAAGFLAYLALPSPAFPTPPPDSVQSQELGDSEDLTRRRAYFTNYTRQEVLNHYQNQFGPIPSFRLNYPPEESQTLIRDQTRSTFLEEIVHPLRESIFVNGFEPTDPKDDVWYKGVDYRQKIIIKYAPSNVFVRLGVGALALGAIWLIFRL